MCDCIGTMNTALKAHNTMLVFTLLGNPARAVIDTMQIETGRGKKKAAAVIATYCPFCGQRYEKEPAVPAEPIEASA
ncbi:hypothetical protein [Sphingobium yanoikuyae]|uniref:hypothetical protein n=1 Tax=Sphingobium yanoikuyae TaxID=13690 RepID=UPI000846B6D3|nr:hypothetical protein [Sphingobium yanoikuyae]